MPTRKRARVTKDDVKALYRLSRMPFELGRYDAPRVGREEEWERLIQIVVSARGSQSPIVGVLLGTYGAGKSFLLWHLAEHFTDASSSHVLATRPLRLIDPEQRRDFIRNLILRLFRRGIQPDVLAGIVKAAARTRRTIPPTVARFAPLLLALANKKNAAAARRVLDGGRALRTEAAAGGFPDAVQVKTSDDAIELLQALQVILRWSGVEVLALLIDEVEYVDGLPRGQRATVFDSLKHLWDQDVTLFSGGAEAAQLAFVLAATPQFWQDRSQQLRTEQHRPEAVVGLTPFFARIPKENVIEMPAEMAPKEARQLIVSRMSEVREGRNAEALIPFSEDYVGYVYELTQGLPRTIIEICATVMSEAVRRKLPKIDRAAARTILRDLLISYEPVSAKA